MKVKTEENFIIQYLQSLSKFKTLTKIGLNLRQLYFLKDRTIENLIIQYPEDDDNIVSKPKFVGRKVFIKETQYCDVYSKLL
ncbi:hypothetical protein RCH18_000164 [Flavobacterium sp. PL11]|jgi:hypothetical protein|nr:hypothetical protein [Flavobacterium sp. PL11]